MKKMTKPANRPVTKKKTKTEPKAGTTGKTAVKPRAGQKITSSGDAKAKKVVKAKEVTPSAAKPRVKAGIKTKTETAARLKAKVKTEIKPPAKTKSAAKKKVAATVAPQKATAAVKTKTKTKIEKKPLKVAAPKKAPPKPVLKSPLKSPLKKVASPAKKTVVVQKKKTAPVKKAVPATAAVKKKTVAVLPKKTPAQAQKKTTLQAAEPAKKPKETLIKAPIKSISKTKIVTTKGAKLPLKKKIPVQASPLIIKAEPSAKTLGERKSGLKPTAKPEEKHVKKVGKAPAKPMVVTTEKPSIRKETKHVATSAMKMKVSGVDKEPAREKQVQTAAPIAVPLKKTRIVRPAVPAVAEEAGDELLSVAEIEAREGRVIKPRLKIFLPREEIREESSQEKEDKPMTGRESLPAEYGESEFFMIVIDPILIFLDWEIAPEDLPAKGLPLCVRIYDVTGITFDGTNAHGFIDIDLEGLAGSGYCETGMQGREIVAEIGFIDAHGAFIALMRSAKAFVPPLLQYDELGIVQKMQEAGLPVGY